MSTDISRDTWNPAQYGRFQSERSRPFFDLLGLVRARPDMRVADLGCGGGELTREMHRTLAARETIGVDSSAAMLAGAAAPAEDGLRFEQADLREFAARDAMREAFDLVLSNATLQWIPEQAEVIERLTAMLTAEGQLALQVPSNEDHPSHAVAREVAGEAPFREALGGHVRRFSNLTPEGYAVLLERLGFREQHVRLQVYVHHLPSREGVVEWVRGTLLTDYEKRLSPELFAAFVERYRERLLPQLDDRQPFIYPFKRILVWGSR
ncbi:MAG: methyltransferase domain-containing protein [Dehalococcoidia bacterium]